MPAEIEMEVFEKNKSFKIEEIHIDIGNAKINAPKEFESFIESDNNAMHILFMDIKSWDKIGKIPTEISVNTKNENTREIYIAAYAGVLNKPKILNEMRLYGFNIPQIKSAKNIPVKKSNAQVYRYIRIGNKFIKSREVYAYYNFM